jgi:hypothetical protein
MDYYLVGTIAFGVGVVVLTLLVIGLMGLLKDVVKHQRLLLANYKADLEMVLLNVHDFDEFLKMNQEAVIKKALDPETTYYIK